VFENVLLSPQLLLQENRNRMLKMEKLMVEAKLQKHAPKSIDSFGFFTFVPPVLT